MESASNGGNLLSSFFNQHPQILKNSIEVSGTINSDIGYRLLSKTEISFDIILPFLFSGIELAEAKNLSYFLGVHREIVDRYNNNCSNVIELVRLLKNKNFILPISFDEYRKINKKTRVLKNNNIVDSYLTSTKRVYYRFLINNNIIQQNIDAIKNLSAFLLFDDDVYDLEIDLANKKETILIRYLKEQDSIDVAIKEILQLLNNNNNSILGHFENILKNLYL